MHRLLHLQHIVGPLLRTQVRGTLGGPHLPVELHIPAFDDIELGYKLREVDPLHFDKHFRSQRAKGSFPTIPREHPDFIGIWSQTAE